jgi:hypothetical protein
MATTRGTGITQRYSGDDAMSTGGKSVRDGDMIKYVPNLKPMSISFSGLGVSLQCTWRS